MTPSEIDVFMEERKWDYRDIPFYISREVISCSYAHSIRIHCRTAGATSIYRLCIFDLEPDWGRHVGAW